MNQINIYHRPDAVDGVGFLIEHCARPQHSIAWPDRIGERMTPEELDRRGVTFEPMGPMDCPCPEGCPVAVQVDVVTGIHYDDETGDVDVQYERQTVHAATPEIAKQLEEMAGADEPAGDTVPPAGETAVASSETKAPSSILPESITEATSQLEGEVPTTGNPAMVTEGNAAPEGAPKSEAEQIREYLTANPEASNKSVIEAMAAAGITISSSQVSRQRAQLKG